MSCATRRILVLRRRVSAAVEPVAVGPQAVSDEPRERPLDALNYREGAGIGVIQSLALLAGIGRSGVTLAAACSTD